MSENSLNALHNRKFDLRLESVLDLMEDLEGKMQTLVKQVYKLLNPKPKSVQDPDTGEWKVLEPNRKIITPLHRYANRAGLLKSMKEDPDPEAIVRSLAEFDPTADRATFMPWICRTVGRGGINLPEDGPSLLNGLAKFARIKKKRTYKGYRDIMKFQDFQEFQATMMDFDEESKETMTKRQTKDWAGSLGKVAYEDGGFKMVVFDPRQFNEERIDIQATKVVLKRNGEVYGANWVLPNQATEEDNQWLELAKRNQLPNDAVGRPQNTRGVTLEANVNPMALGVMDTSIKADSTWCTSGPDYAMSYLDNGPMYMFFKTVNDSGAAKIQKRVDEAEELKTSGDQQGYTSAMKQLNLDGFSPNDVQKVGEKVPYMLCEYKWGRGGGSNNRANVGISVLSEHFFIFLCKVMLCAEPGEKTVRAMIEQLDPKTAEGFVERIVQGRGNGLEPFNKNALARINQMSDYIFTEGKIDRYPRGIQQLMIAGKQVCGGNKSA